MKGKLKRNLLGSMLLAGMGLMLNANPAEAQDRRMSLYFGPYGGVQYTNLKSNHQKFKGALGFNGGLSGEMKFTKSFAMDLNMLYSSYNATRSYTDSVQLYDRWAYQGYATSENYNYFTAEVLAKWVIGMGRNPIIPYDNPNSRQDVVLNLMAGGFVSNLRGWSWDGYQNEGTITTYQRTLIDPPNTSRERTYRNAALSSPQKPYYVAPENYGAIVGAGMGFKFSNTVSGGFDLKFMYGLNNKLDVGDSANPRYGYYEYYNNAADPTKNKLSYVNSKTSTQALALSFYLRFRLFGKDPD